MTGDGGVRNGADRRVETSSASRIGMREGVPDERLFSRSLKVFGDVEVGHHRFLPGETAFPDLPGHLVNLHLGAPTRVATRRGEGRWEGTQPPGTVEVYSAGKATEQAIRDASEDVSVLLGEGFFEGVAGEVGMDLGRVEILDRFEARDATVERILLSLLPELETEGLGANSTRSLWRPPSRCTSSGSIPPSGRGPCAAWTALRGAVSRLSRCASS